MKKALCIFFLAIVTLAATSCKKIIDLLFSPVDISVPAFQVHIPAVPVVTPGEALLGSFTAHFNLDSAIKAKTGGVFGASAISSIKVKQITVDVPDADKDNNLANFESARFTIYSSLNSSSAEIEPLLFPDVYSASSTLTPANSPELKTYFNSTELTYNLFAKNRKPTTKPLTVAVTITFSVK